ncbi:hypothetical protein Tco_0658170 [Tanacetum coccineum]
METTKASSPAKRSKASKVVKKRTLKSSQQLVDEFVDEGVPADEPRFEDEEAEIMQKVMEESLKDAYPAPRGPLPPMVIREPEPGKFQPLPKTPKKKNPAEQFIFQRRTPATAEPSGLDETSSLYAELGLTVSETDSDEEVSPKTNAEAQEEVQGGTNPGDAGVSQTPSSHVVHAGPNLDHMDLGIAEASSQPNAKQMDEEFTATAYLKVHENLKLPTEGDVRLEEPASSAATLSSLQNLDKEISFTNQFLAEKSQPDELEKTNNEMELQSMVTVPIHQDTSSVPLMTMPVIDLTVSQLASTTIQASIPTSTATITATTTTTFPPPPPQPQQGVSNSIIIQRIGELEQHMADLVEENQALEERLDKQGHMMYQLENQDLSGMIREQTMEAPLRARFKDLPTSDMKEILLQCMLEENYDKGHEDHKMAYEVLQQSILRDEREQFDADKDKKLKQMKRKHDSPKTPPGSPPPPPPPPPSGPSGASGTTEASDSAQDPPPPPPSPTTNQSDQSKGTDAPSSSKTATSTEYTAWTTTDTRIKPSVQSSGDEDIGRDHIPTVNLRQSWWKPLTEDRPATPEPAWSIPSSDPHVLMNNWASALASTYTPPPENSLLAQTDDIATFMDWFCKKQGIKKIKQQDLEGPAYEIVKVFHPNVIYLQYQMEECHKLLTDQVDEPIIRYNVNKPLPRDGPPGQVTIQSDFFFNKDLEYLRYGHKKYTELTPGEAIQADCDIIAINIILQGLPTEIYALVSQHRVAKDLWEKIKLLMQGTSLTKQEREFNAKFLNTLPDECSKFVTDVKLVKDLHTTNVDQLHAYLEQHERHANEVRLMHERNSDPLALVASHQITQSPYQTHQHTYQNTQLQPPASTYPSPQYGSPYQSQQYSTHQSSTPLSTYTPGASGSNSRKQRTVIFYNCKGEGHMSRQCTKPKRKRDDSWFKEKVLMVQAQAHGQILNEEELAFLADPDIPEVALLVNLSHYGSDALVKVHNHDNMNNNVAHQAVQVMPSSQQSNVVNHSETKITSDSNIIPYSQYVIESQQVTVQNSNSSAEQDDLILSVIEQLKTQVANCTKTNLENKSVNDTLTFELEIYKEQVKVLKEGQNGDLRSKDNVSNTCAQSVEIDLLKQTLLEHLKEKESLLQTVTLLKNDFKKEESRNIDREIALEKQIKHLDNIQSKPKLYVGDIIVQTNPIVIPDSEETLALAEESRSKMLLKHKDNMMLEKEKQVDTTPIDYVALNKDFSTRFVPQTELSAEQAFWSKNSMNSSEPTLSIRPTNVEVPKELPKVSMVNTSLKKLKYHLANFDVVVKERTTPTAITEGSWGFEHTKACFRDEIIPFAVEQHRIESKTFEVKMNQVLNENERLLELVTSRDIVNLLVNPFVENDSVNVLECQKCLQLETELQTDFVKRETYNKLFKNFTILEKHCISLEVDTQLK